MLGIIPSSIAKVKAAHKGAFLINNYHFFVMTPQERDKDVVRMPENFDIPVHFRQIELNEL